MTNVDLHFHFGIIGKKETIHTSCAQISFNLKKLNTFYVFVSWLFDFYMNWLLVQKQVPGAAFCTALHGRKAFMVDQI